MKKTNKKTLNKKELKDKEKKAGAIRIIGGAAAGIGGLAIVARNFGPGVVQFVKGIIRL